MAGEQAVCAYLLPIVVCSGMRVGDRGGDHEPR